MGYRWPTMPGTGQAAVWQGVSNIGQAVGDLGEVFNEQQAQVELEAFKIEFEGEIDKLGDSISKNQDENTYLAKTNKVITGTNNYMPKNGLAKRFASSFVNQRTPQLRDDAKEAMKLRVKDKWQAGLIAEEDKAVKSGNAIDYLTYIGAGLVNDSIDEAAAAKAISDTRNKMEYEAGLQWARTNPAEVLEAFENAETVDGQIQFGGFTTLSEGQVSALRWTAEGTENFNERRKTEAVSAGKDQVSTTAWDAMVKGEYAIAQETILSAPDELGTTWKKAELTKLSESSKLLNEKGINSYTDRQDDAAYQDAIEKALDKQLTIDEANEGVGGPWTITDGKYLRSIIDGDENTNQVQAEVDASKLITALIKEAGEKFKKVGAGISANKLGQRELEDAIKAAKATGKPLEGTDLENKALEIGRRLARRVAAGESGEDILPGVREPGLKGLRFGETVRTSRTIGSIPAGTVIGTKNSKGGIDLNRMGVLQVMQINDFDPVKARQYSAERNYVAPKEK